MRTLLLIIALLSVPAFSQTVITGAASPNQANAWTGTQDFQAQVSFSFAKQASVRCLHTDASTGIQTNASVTNTYIAQNLMSNVATRLSAAATSLSNSDLPTTFSTLTTCAAGLDGNQASLSDEATAVAYNGAVTGGGSTHLKVRCNGTSWLQD